MAAIERLLARFGNSPATHLRLPPAAIGETEIGHFAAKAQAAAYVALGSYEGYDYRLLARELKTPVVVENRAGASGMLAAIHTILCGASTA